MFKPWNIQVMKCGCHDDRADAAFHLVEVVPLLGLDGRVPQVGDSAKPVAGRMSHAPSPAISGSPFEFAQVERVRLVEDAAAGQPVAAAAVRRWSEGPVAQGEWE